MTELNEPRLKVLSLNCWGLWLVAHKRKERLQAIAEWISNSEYDIIALQEIWVKSDFDLIVSKSRSVGLNYYSKFFYSGAIGSGLGFLSKFPIESSFLKPFILNGNPLNFIQGDWFAGKSICGITITVPRLGIVEILNTHLFAPGGEGDKVEASHRVSQGFELSKLVNEIVEQKNRNLILTGDFNSQPHSPIIQLLLNYSNLLDSWKETHQEPPEINSREHLNLNSLQVLNTHGITCDSPLNTYSLKKLKNKSPNDEIIIRGGKRLDYIFYRSPPPSNSHTPYQLNAKSCSLKLTEPIPNISPPISYSDHFALETIFTFTSSSSSSSNSSPPPPLSLESVKREKTIELLSSASLLLSKSLRQNSINSRFQLKLFLLSLILIPVLSIASSFEPLQYLNWIIVLLGITNGALGMLLLLVGFVHARWEMGGLRNLLQELESELNRLRLNRRRSENRASCSSNGSCRDRMGEEEW
ncbi:hypothetical protein JCM3765_000212 [Sporobolomyces pararoseus]